MTFSESCTAISDTSGKLAFSSNGIFTGNKEHKRIDNEPLCEILDPPLHTGYGCWPEDSGPAMRVPQAVVLLPRPGHDSLYYLFNTYYLLAPSLPSIGVMTLTLHVSELNTQLNGGLGGYRSFRDTVLQDTLNAGGLLTACRHANGRDWWLIVPTTHFGGYYRILVDPAGIHVLSKETMPRRSPYLLVGNTAFSPDGSKMVINTYVDTAYTADHDYHQLIYSDFDRCTGYLSNTRYFDVPYPFISSDSTGQGGGGGGVCFSPDSRYLYATFWRVYLYQFDTYNADPFEERRLVDRYEHYIDTVTNFGSPLDYLVLGPDNRIYINGGQSRYIHVINHPNEEGEACDVVQRYITMSNFACYNMPNFPYFRTGPVDGSPCDTLGIDDISGVSEPPLPPYSAEARVWVDVVPQPMDGIGWVRYYAGSEWGGVWRLYDISGREVQVAHAPAREGLLELDVSSLSSGVYVGTLRNEAGYMATCKVVVR
jgi:hypothetical protein